MLHFDLKINGTPIGYFKAVRIAGDERRDSLNTYRVELRGAVGAWDGEVQHYYGDGAWELVRKVLQAKRDADDDPAGLDDLEGLTNDLAVSGAENVNEEYSDWLAVAADLMMRGWHR